MKGIFISYRRQDSQSAAGRLADHLRENMHGVPIFRDVETIEPGINFVEAINRALQSCGILLAIIGPRWVSLPNAAGQRRLDDPDDYTRQEIFTALQNGDVRVIPVLVEGAQMPGKGDLPDELKIFASLNAIELTDKRWKFDISQLVETLNKALDVLPEPKPPQPDPVPPSPVPPPPPLPPATVSWKRWAWGFGVLLIFAAAYNAEEYVSEPVVPVVSGPVPQSQYSTPQRPTIAPPLTLTGSWRDAEGGNYRFIQQGIQVAFQGVSPHGAVSGAGVFQGNLLNLEYVLKGYPYQAVLQVSPDGLNLVGQYRGLSTGESGQVHLQRNQ